MDRDQQIGPDDAGDEMHLLFDHLVCQLFGNIGFTLVIAVDHRTFHPAEGVTDVIQTQLEGILHLLTDDSSRPERVVINQTFTFSAYSGEASIVKASNEPRIFLVMHISSKRN